MRMKPDQPDLTTPDGDPRPVHEPETMPSLEELLREAELKAAEHHDAWLRAKAEAENIRKRAADDVTRRTSTASRTSPPTCSRSRTASRQRSRWRTPPRRPSAAASS